MSDDTPVNIEAIPESVKAEATDWFLRFDADEVHGDEEDAFVIWLTESELHQVAYADVENLWSDMGEMQKEAVEDTLSTADVHTTQPANESIPTRTGTVQWARGFAMAATILLALFLGERGVLWLEADYVVGVGEQHVVQLSDGSEVTLNTNSAIDVNYDQKERRIVLLQGEAFFKVAKDSGRPFIVSANEVETTALGTAFNIKMMGEQTQVTVTEHSVKVVATAQAGQSNGIEVVEGQRVNAIPSQMGAVEVADIRKVEAWRQQRLIFRDQMLGEVVAELNRYYSGRIVILDDSISNLKVTGVFSTKDPIATLETIEKNLLLDTFEITPFLVMIKSK